MQIKITL